MGRTLKLNTVKKSLALFVLAISFGPGFVHAERRGDQGVGLMVGNPSGATWKMWMDENLALDAAVGVARSEFDVHATILWHDFNFTKRSKAFDSINQNGQFPVYIGVGPRLLFEHNREFGVRFPVGVSFLPNETRWEMFLEVAPVLRITPDVGFNGDFAIGARYYFPAIRPTTTR